MAVRLHLLLWQIIILLICAIKASTIKCPTSCGNISEIRYPFGIGVGCYFNESFEVTCNMSSGSPVPFFSKTNLKISEDISRRGNGMAIGLIIYGDKSEAVNMSGTPFHFSHKLNKFMATGCHNYTTTFERLQNKLKNGCIPLCTCDPAKDKNSYDFMCSIPSEIQSFSDINVLENCTGAVMVEQDWLRTNRLAITNPNCLKERELYPVVMEFGRYMGTCTEPYKSKSGKRSCNKDNFCLIQSKDYFCVCSQPRQQNEKYCTGNLFCSENECPNCPDGYDTSNTSDNGKPMCYPSPRSREKKNEGITIGKNEGITIVLSVTVGTLSLTIGGRHLYEFVRRRIANKRKKIFFEKNGGPLLEDGNIQKPKFFAENELEKATDSYNDNRILDQGDQGTVYKGMLKEGRIVAVKRLQKVAEEVYVFIKEVSQINHRNVVKFLGCCLETEFPLLVYEFIPNGKLSQYIHEKNEEFPLTWKLRLRIAIEVAYALSYLHSDSVASVSMYHRDIKSSNILLGEKYRAKVSDVGTPVDQTHLIENTSDTKKSDVYSFGVVLAELLTGQKPIRSTDLEEVKDLASYFLQIMEEDRLFEIIDAEIVDARVSKDGSEQEIMALANLTRRCLDSNESERPTMEEVATELAGIRPSIGASISKQNCEEIDVEDKSQCEPNDEDEPKCKSQCEFNVEGEIQCECCKITNLFQC